MKKFIISTVVVAGLFSACGNKTEETNKNEVVKTEQTHEVKKEETKSAAHKVDAIVAKAHEKTKEVAVKVEEKAKEVKEEVKEVAVKVEEKAKEVKEEVKEVAVKVEEKAEDLKEKANNLMGKLTSKKEEVKTASKTAAQLFGACAGCHGADASKKALGKSEVVKGWDSAKIEAALNGYKDGSYGGAMKGIMKGQVSKLSSEDIKNLAEHISKF